jgi:hypothetical protein
MTLLFTGNDPFWEAIDIWYGSMDDLEWYDPQQVTTRNSQLVITMGLTATTQSGLTPSSNLRITNQTYRSGMRGTSFVSRVGISRLL